MGNCTDKQSSNFSCWLQSNRAAGTREVHQSRQEEELESSHPTESGGGILGAERQLSGVPSYHKELQIPDTSDS